MIVSQEYLFKIFDMLGPDWQAFLVVFPEEQHFINQILAKYQSMVDNKVYATKLSFGRQYLLTLVCCCHLLSVL